ncbi:hypothetical protein AJ80_03586 [Polytolypa hystricis UAMH7299]|uniref:Erythromycin esterase n=1 Tax=Polytolypa hystricis (strain UAMH7299) TaxID=1447883 RepID=A0A2B7YGY2_POLH7|nr:hypothetical protein AJ80_03586 [Polytolypa hystricis UAMH7299]
MATPLRRSNRLRSITPTTTEVQSNEPKQPKEPRSSKKLKTVVERDETPELSLTNIDAVVATPLKRTNSTPKTASSQSKKTIKTPSTTGFRKPGPEGMHPSKVQKSTTKQPDSGLRLGFRPIEKDSKKPSMISNTPTKARLPEAGDLGSPGFDFKFSCQDSQLSDEARKLMESLRDEAARIKAQMVIDQNEKKHEDGSSEQSIHGRKIAAAKGKAGRFSNAHMAQFKKMDSIAGHPSAFRANQDRLQPAGKSLKRTSSKANLGEPERTPATKKTTAISSPSKTPVSSPMKRLATSTIDDKSTRQPVTRSTQTQSARASRTVRHPPTSLSTPKRPTTLRPSSVKHQTTTKIPAFPKSPSTKSIKTPRTPQTEFNPRLKSGLPTLANLRSILRRRQPLFSTDPAKIAAGTHLPPPNTDSLKGPGTCSPKKRVEFTESIKSRHGFCEVSPSPARALAEPPTAASLEFGQVTYPTLPPMTPPQGGKAEKPITLANLSTPTIRAVPSQGLYSRPSFLSRSPIPHGIVNKKRHREDDDADTENSRPADESAQDERSAKRAKKTITSTTPAVVSRLHTPSPVKQRSPVKGVTPARATPATSGTVGTAAQRARRALSLSRLNLLARPKERR